MMFMSGMLAGGLIVILAVVIYKFNEDKKYNQNIDEISDIFNELERGADAKAQVYIRRVQTGNNSPQAINKAISERVFFLIGESDDAKSILRELQITYEMKALNKRSRHKSEADVRKICSMDDLLTSRIDELKEKMKVNFS